MKKITLFCAGGMSTSLLVNKMREAAAAQGKEYDINAYGLSTVDVNGPEADVILLGPQVRYAEKQIRTKFPGKKIASMDMRYYGTMNGKAILATAEKLLDED